MALLDLEARASGLELEPEDGEVTDGLDELRRDAPAPVGRGTLSSKAETDAAAGAAAESPRRLRPDAADPRVRAGDPPLFQKGDVHGTTHLYSGQEASGVGVCSMLGEGDKVAGTYRGHGHALALGVSAPEA